MAKKRAGCSGCGRITKGATAGKQGVTVKPGPYGKQPVKVKVGR